eukprot:2365663-Rhodomonas_salina.2
MAVQASESQFPKAPSLSLVNFVTVLNTDTMYCENGKCFTQKRRILVWIPELFGSACNEWSTVWGGADRVSRHVIAGTKTRSSLCDAVFDFAN